MVSPKYSYLIGIFFAKILNLTIIVHLQSVIMIFLPEALIIYIVKALL